jgi:two-component system, LuxR family, response regulator FixJ
MNARERQEDRELLLALVDADESAQKVLIGLLESAKLGLNAKLRVEKFSSAEELLDNCELSDLACIVTEVDLPGLSGLELQGLVADMSPHTTLVFISENADTAVAVSAIKSGALDFLRKPISAGLFTSTIEQAIARSTELRLRGDQRQSVLQEFQQLTKRERQVLALMLLGLRNKQIAAELNVAVKTVKIHRGRVMSKMQAQSFFDLMQKASIIDRLAERLGAVLPVNPPKRVQGATRKH